MHLYFLRWYQSVHRVRRVVDGAAASSPSTTTDYMTALEATLVNGVLSDDDDEEFFDFPDSEHEASQFAGNQPWAGAGESMASLDVDEGDRWLTLIDGRLDDATTDKEEIYLQMKLKKSEYTESAHFYWRLAKATHFAGIVAQSAGDIAKKRELAFEAHK